MDAALHPPYDASADIDEFESALRAMFPDDEPFPPEWEAHLAGCPRNTPRERVLYLGNVIALIRERYNAAFAPAAAGDAAAAGRELLARSPVIVTLASGRRVPVTGRSLNAIARIAAHGMRLRLLEAAIQDVAQRFAEAEAAAAAARWWTRRRAVRRMARLERFHARLHTEAEHQRGQLWAHATSADGAPAPEGVVVAWGGEVAPEDDGALLLALIDVGPARMGRYHRGVPPAKGGKPDGRPDLGWDALPTWYGQRFRTDPAACRDLDLGQMDAALVAAAPAVDPLED